MENKPKNKPHSNAISYEDMNLENETKPRARSLEHPESLLATEMKNSPRFNYSMETPCIKPARVIAMRA